MIEIGVNQVYKNFGFKNVLAGLSFEVMTGDRVALVGRNGTGKSTIFKIISGEENPDKGAINIRKGAVLGYLEQIPTLPKNEKTAGEVLSEAFADIFDIERNMRKLEADMAEEQSPAHLDTLMSDYEKLQNEFLALDGYSAEERLNRIIEGFQLRKILELPFQVLSGGQKTIVKLARTILDEPDILLLDEPTNHLDITTLEWFETYLTKYKGTVLIISHDRQFLDRVATRTIFLESGTGTVFNGNYSFALKEQERLLLLEFEDYKNQQKKINAMKAAIKRFRLWGSLNPSNTSFYKKAKELEKRIEKMEILEKPQLEKPKINLDFSGDYLSHDVLTVENLSIAFDELVLLENVSFKLFEREKICLMGSNGTGKTTFLNALMDTFQDYTGKIKLADSAKIGYIPQEIRFENDKASVLETFRRSIPCPEAEARRHLSRYFFYGENVFKRVSSLSGGEKVLLKLSILVLMNVNLLILDEPTNHIDIETREMLEESLSEFPSTILFISHDRYFIQKLANRILLIQNRDIKSFYDDGTSTVFPRR